MSGDFYISHDGLIINLNAIIYIDYREAVQDEFIPVHMREGWTVYISKEKDKDLRRILNSRRAE